MINLRSLLFAALVLMNTHCYAAPLPDVIVTSLSYNKATGVFTSVVKNQGMASTPPNVTVGVSYSVDGVKRSWGASNAALAPGASVTIGSNGGTYAIPNGIHTITAVADDVNRFPESDETNNALSQSITVGYVFPLLPDVIVTSLSYDSATGFFTSVVTNQGGASTPAGVTVGVSYSVDGVKRTWGYTLAPLAPGASVTVGTNGGAYAIPSGTHTITAVADDVNRFPESNKLNNTLSQQITVGSSVPPGTGLGTIASLTAHNTSAYANYDQNHFPANFGTTSYISKTQTVTIDPAKMDRSMNPVTPGHVSRMNVHLLIPSRPDLRWFAHVMPWYSDPICNPICVGYNADTDTWVHSLVDDLRRRGFNGIELSWDGPNTQADSIVHRIKSYVATLPSGSFSYMVNVDQGLVVGKPNKQAILENAINWIKGQYFGDPNYEKEGSTPLVLFYGMRNQLGAAGMISAKANTGGNMFWSDVDITSAFLNESWEDAAYDSHDAFIPTDIISPSDPYNLATVGGFLSTVGAVPQKKGIGAMASSNNGTISGYAQGYYLPQDSGELLVKRAQFINAHIPANVTRMHWFTWNDYPEGTSVEPGVENNVTVTASISGSTLNWTYTSGYGDESTIDHYEVYASSDGVNAAYLNSIPAGQHSFSLGSTNLKSGTSYSAVVVVAVGKPCIRDHVSNSVSFTTP